MGEHEGWTGQPSGLLLNGLLLNESTPVICVLNAERWLRAEERTTELIACIQPNGPSEERRNAVADYVQRLIMKCFPCQVFTFGSVPLKTYLPDGDIDLTVFSNNPSLKDTWATLVRDILEIEEKNENAEFCVKEVQYIQAEVKIIKCLVENIVVDISFNQLGGLCTLCFLEEVDHLIRQNHLFKRSIILIKAWCYYESRILGAHHGLISTYALETLVLYIFHVFNNSFAGPLEVLYRFLEFFSNFDWDNFCVSLWGPVPISSLPDVTPDPPRKDGGELLLTRGFLEKCNAAYADLPTGQENQGQPFISKHFNIIDPLRVNNNLGRSVSKGNFFRIRSAFAFGAKKLAKLLYCPKEDIFFELNQFFMNTWERHGSGNRPDAPTCIIQHLIPSTIDQLQGLNNRTSLSSRKKKNERSSARDSAVEGMNSTYTYSIEHSNNPSEITSAKNDVSSVSHAQTQKGYANQNSSRMPDQSEKGVSNQGTQVDRSQRSMKLDNNVNEYIQGKYLFARTRSSPELTETYADKSSQGRRYKATESAENQIVSTKTDNSRRKNGRSGSVSTQSTVSSTDDPPVKHMSTHQNAGIPIDANGLSNNSIEDSGHVNMSEERASVVGAQGMLQEEQDLVNMISSSVNNFGGQFPMPLNFSSTHLPLPFSPSMLASIGYHQRNLAGLMPGNVPLVEPSWPSNLPFAQGLVQSPLPPYFPGIGLSSNSEDLVRQVNDNHDSADIVTGDADSEIWHERDGSSSGRFVPEDGNMVWVNTDDRQPSTSGSSGFVQTPRNVGSSRHQQKYAKENRGSMGGRHHDNFQHQDARMNDVYPDDRVGSTRFSSASQASSLRSKSSSEGSWDGSSAKGSKISKDKKGMKSTASTMPSTVYGKGKRISEHASVDVEDESGDWNVATSGTEMAEGSSASQPGAALYLPRRLLSGHEAAQTSGADSFLHMDPVLIGPGSRQRGADGSGSLPFTFYPTGPPVPFVTMLPFYNFPTDGSSPDALSNQLGREEGLHSSVSIQSFESCDGLDDSKALNASISTGRASPEEPRDILNSDFLSHWHNLQYGRSCQNPRVVYPSPVVVPPGYLQGRFPWDGPGRPLGTNVNMFSQIMSYSPRLVPVPPVQPVSDTPAGDYQRYVDDLPRYRAGTGTYLPTPKATRDRNSSGARRNNYNYDRNDHRGDRDGNWNASKSRAANRGHNRNQADKSSSRLYRQSTNESRAERPWNSHVHESLPSYQSQNGPLHPSSSQSNSANVTYGMYQVPGMNPNHAASNGPPAPPVVMFYPYDNSSGYGGSPGEPLEFGSVGPMGFMGSNEVSQHVMEGARARGTVEEQRFHGSSQRSSPDQPSSPHFQRRT